MLPHVLFALTLAQLPNPTVVEWRHRPEEPGRVYLFVHGRQLGGYDRDRDEWRDFDPDRRAWSPPRSLFAAQVADFGVMRDRLGGPECYSLCGVPVTAQRAREAVGALRDDSQYPWLTVIGSAEQRQQVLNDLEQHAALPELRRQLRVQTLAPDHWAIADAGFFTAGNPTIYLQAPDGRVLHRQDEYRGPEALAEAIRRADPNYRPELDPDLNRSSLRSRLAQLPGWAWAAIALLLLFTFQRRTTS